MAADVSSREGERDLVTRDLLGGFLALGSHSDDRDLDLSVQVVTTARHHYQFDLLQKRGPVTLHRALQDLNQPPKHGALGLDLRLEGPATAANRLPTHYESVCTLEKVKSALERARRESEGSHRARPRRSDGSPSPTSSSSSVTSISSMRRRKREDETDGCDSSPEGLTAAGCPSCLMYVLISKADPRCPRCDSHVSVPVLLHKRPRIDLNSTVNN